LKFDGSFIVDFLFRLGYEWSSKRRLDEKTFTTLISDMGMWYTIKIRGEDGPGGLKREVTIYDSLKIIPMPIAQMPKTFDIGLEKLDLDYEGDREEGHELTEHEKLYIRNDTLILARSLKFMREHNMKKLTTASNAMNDFKTRLGKAEFDRLFPPLDAITDRDIRMSYKGGFTYLNPVYKNKPIGRGQVYDVNSMYPWAMKFCKLPYGEPVYFTGQYEEDEGYPLYVQSLVCDFKLKPGCVPSIQIKNNFHYSETEYLRESEVETVLTLTSVDLKLFFDNYDVTVYSWEGGYKFKGMVGMFADYIDYWYEQKNEGKRTGNKGLTQIAKLMLNSLYGKFGASLTGRSKIPQFDRDQDKVTYYYGAEESRTAYYVPVASFITSYARDKIIRAAQQLGERFIYADTDSLHVKGTEPADIDIDEYRLGAFKIEEEFDHAIFIRQKTYMESINGKNDVKCAGMPNNIKETVTFENFKEGATFEGKLMPRIIPGGTILRETTFKIKSK
jgi:hypothetical protein